MHRLDFPVGANLHQAINEPSVKSFLNEALASHPFQCSVRIDQQYIMEFTRGARLSLYHQKVAKLPHALAPRIYSPLSDKSSLRRKG